MEPLIGSVAGADLRDIDWVIVVRPGSTRRQQRQRQR
jgi:protein gp37